MLVQLVEYHAQVNAVSKGLLERTMNAFVADITAEALRCFRQIRGFGMGGMLRVSTPLDVVIRNAHRVSVEHSLGNA